MGGTELVGYKSTGPNTPLTNCIKNSLKNFKIDFREGEGEKNISLLFYLLMHL